jgi:hypothetical protein
MTKQLTLINGSTKRRAGHAWQLDAHTRELGRTGVAKARAALQAGRQGRAEPPPPEPRGRTPASQRRSAA